MNQDPGSTLFGTPEEIKAYKGRQKEEHAAQAARLKKDPWLKETREMTQEEVSSLGKEDDSWRSQSRPIEDSGVAQSIASSVPTQAVLGGASAFTWPLDALKLLSYGGANQALLDMNDTAEQGDVRPVGDTQRDIDSNLKYFPTQQLAEDVAKDITGIDFAPKDEYGKGARLAGMLTGAVANPGAGVRFLSKEGALHVAKKAAAATAGATASQGMQSLGANEFASDVTGMFVAGVIPAIAGFMKGGVKAILGPRNIAEINAELDKQASEKLALQKKTAIEQESLFPASKRKTEDVAGKIKPVEKTPSSGRSLKVSKEPDSVSAMKTSEQGDLLQRINNNIAEQQRVARLNDAEYLSDKFDPVRAARNLKDKHSGVILSTISPFQKTPQEVGAEVKKELNMLQAEERGIASERYDVSRASIGDRQARVGDIRKTVSRIIDKIQTLVPTMKGESSVMNNLEKIYEAVRSGQYVPIKDLIEWKKALYESINFEQLDPTARKGVKKYLSEVTGEIESTIQKELGKDTAFGKKLSKQALEDYNAAQKGWAEYCEKWGDDRIIDALNLPQDGVMDYSNPEIFSKIAPATQNTTHMVERKAIESATKNVTENTLEDTAQLRKRMSQDAQDAAKEIIDANTPGASKNTLYAKKKAVALDVNNYLVTKEQPLRVLEMMKDPEQYKIVEETFNDVHNGKALFEHMKKLSTENALTMMSNDAGMLDPKKVKDFIGNKKNRHLFEKVFPKETKELVRNLVDKNQEIKTRMSRFVKEQGAMEVRANEARTVLEKDHVQRLKGLGKDPVSSLHIMGLIAASGAAGVSVPGMSTALAAPYLYKLASPVIANAFNEFMMNIGKDSFKATSALLIINKALEEDSNQ